jgi:hypothetical protein
MVFIDIATEDSLSQAVAERLVSEYTNFQINLRLGLKGNGFLRKNLKNYYEISRREPFLLIADLDRTDCAVNLIDNWNATVNMVAPDNFLFRVVKREIECWLLADNEGLGAFLKITKVPRAPEELADPKQELLNLAQKAPRQIREDLVVKKGYVASQGVGYNARLIEFVRDKWNPKKAAKQSDSLARASKRLKELSLAFDQ